MSNELGKYLRQIRGTRSLREVAERSQGKLSHNIISTAEKGVGTHGNSYVPSPEKLKAFADVYGVSYAKLMSLAGYSEETPKWASTEDVTDLERVLKLNDDLEYRGEKLSNEDRQQLLRVIEAIFWEQREKKRDRP